jgi:uncharacterized membrane protein YfcA
MNNNYLIPANSKKSQLILGFLTYVDLGIFGVGLITTTIMLFIFKNPDLPMMIMMLLPLLISAFLVMPVQYYHNMLQLITNIVMYFNGRRHYLWKGWCISDGNDVK